jgi:CCR4-NOT transcription complex subunit 7/8
VLNEDTRWIAFHSGYDFGYLLKVLTNKDLPEEEREFFELLNIYFPKLSDVKYIMKSCENLKGGLNQLADDLAVTRIGPAHQAGSDSLLTCFTYFKIMNMFLENNFDDPKFLGIIYGLNGSQTEKESKEYSSLRGENIENTVIVNNTMSKVV